MKGAGLMKTASGSEYAPSQIGKILLIPNRIAGAVGDKCRRGAQKPLSGRLAGAKTSRGRFVSIDVVVLKHDEACRQSGRERAIEVGLGNDLEGVKTHVYRIARGASRDNPDRGSVPRPSRKRTNWSAMECAA